MSAVAPQPGPYGQQSCTGARILHVPYRGGGPAINDLLAGTIDMMFDVTPALVPHVESGKFRALALSSQQRMDFLPSVPGMAEFHDLGLQGLDLVTWNALMTAPGLWPTMVSVGRQRQSGSGTYICNSNSKNRR